MGFFLREADATEKRAVLICSQPDIDSLHDYIHDVGYWKHQCFILCDFDWRRAKDLYENATLEELVELMRGQHHYYNQKEK